MTSIRLTIDRVQSTYRPLLYYAVTHAAVSAVTHLAMTALGFKLPDAVKWNADVAHKFYRHGVVLKQVANFYNNTIDAP